LTPDGARQRAWNVQAPEGDEEAAAARLLLLRGLALLGMPVDERSPSESDPDGPVIVINRGHGEGHSWAWRRSAERAEIYADSSRAFPWAIYEFLESAGLPLPPWPDSPPAPRPTAFPSRESARVTAGIDRRTAVFAEEPQEGEAGLWREWTVARGFTGTLGPGNHFVIGKDRTGWDDFLKKLEGSECVVLEPAGGLGVEEFLRSSLAYAEKAVARGMRLGFALLYPAERAASLIAAARSISTSDGESIFKGLGLILDDGGRCRGHALADHACKRNEAYAPDRLKDLVSGWEALSGTAPELRLRYGDDPLYRAQAPLLPDLALKDTRYALGLGLGGIQFVVSPRLIHRPDPAAWSFSRACMGGAAGIDDFVRATFPETRGNAAAAAIEGYYRDVEIAWRAVLHREPVRAEIDGIHRPESPLDPSDEDLPSQERAAESYSRVYASLDCAKSGLESAGTALGASRAYLAERKAFSLDEAAIEFSGALRTLYARALSEQGLSRDVFLIVDETLRRFEAAAVSAYREESVRNRAVFLIRDTFRPLLDDAKTVLPAGPFARAFSAISRAFHRTGR
jgi:hypothetical protein